VIEAKALSRHYGDFLAVDEVTFEISKGEIVGLLGPNGAGKTTIMKMLTGYLEPSSGQAVMAGIDVKADRLAAQKKIGYLPENAPLYREMNVYQYLQMVCDIRGIDAAAVPSAIKSALERTQLKDRAFQAIGTLSKGYQQRVGVAQAIIHNPEVLILDEPTNGLDPSQILEMRKLIRDLAKDATIILSTHIMQEVEAICDRVLMIVKGKLVVDSKLKELRQASRLLVRSDRSAEELASALNSIAGVDLVHPGPEGQANVSLKQGSGVAIEEVSAAIAQTVVGKGWKLFGLLPEQRSLETVFKEVTGHNL
jgi:ABC-2 type transport system ATP-binding protein